jgi:hypothetical protein
MRMDLLTALCVALLCQSASAAPITFTFTGNDSGSLDGVAFQSRNFVITAHGDTDNRRLLLNVGGSPFGWSMDHSSAEIANDGFSSVDFTSETRTFVNNVLSSVGFGRAGGADLYDGLGEPSVEEWDMTTSIGPFSSGGFLTQWNLQMSEVQTSGGQLAFNEKFFTTGATFQATVVPEPSTAALLVLGCVLGLVVRRR